MKINQNPINANINIIGSIPDYSLIYSYLCEILGLPIIERKDFLFRTDKTLPRFKTAIKDTMGRFVSQNHQILFSSILINPHVTWKNMMLIFFLQLISGSRMFQLMTDDVYLKAYYSGRSVIKHDEVLAYLKDIRKSYNEMQSWTDSTMDRLASKYLSSLKKMGLLSGAVKKEIIHTYFDDFIFAYFVYYLIEMDSSSDVLSNRFLSYGLMGKDAFVSRLRKRDFAEFWDITDYGGHIKVELKKKMDEFKNVQI